MTYLSQNNCRHSIKSLEDFREKILCKCKRPQYSLLVPVNYSWFYLPIVHPSPSRENNFFLSRWKSQYATYSIQIIESLLNRLRWIWNDLHGLQNSPSNSVSSPLPSSHSLHSSSFGLLSARKCAKKTPNSGHLNMLFIMSQIFSPTIHSLNPMLVSAQILLFLNVLP